MKPLHYLIMTLTTIVLSLSTLSAQQNLATQTRCQGQSFTSLKASTGVDVKLLKDNAFRVVVSAPSKYIGKVKTEVKNGTLNIYIDSCRNCHIDDIDIIVYYNGNITSLETSSGAEIEAKAMHCTKNFTVSATSGSEIEIKGLETPNLTVSATSGSEIEIKGLETPNLTVSATSGSKIEIKGLETPNLTTSATSASEIELKGHAAKATLKASSGAKIDIEDIIIDNITTKTSSGGRIDRD